MMRAGWIKRCGHWLLWALLAVLTLAVPVKELAARRKKWRRPKPRYRHGVLAKFAHTCQSASLGAVTDKDLRP